MSRASDFSREAARTEYNETVRGGAEMTAEYEPELDRLRRIEQAARGIKFRLVSLDDFAGRRVKTWVVEPPDSNAVRELLAALRESSLMPVPAGNRGDRA